MTTRFSAPATSFAPSRRDFLRLGAASAFSLVCAPLSVATAQEENSSPIVLRVAVMSDVHFPGTTDAKEYKRFQRAIRLVYEYSAKHKDYDRFDALMVVGDMSNHGTENEIGLFKKTMDEEIHGETKTLLCMGNHEFYGGGHELWRKTFGVEPNARYEVNGFQFVAVSPEKGSMKDGDYLYALDWFRKELADAVAADPAKPVFVFQHYPVSPTVYGGRGYDDWGLKDLFDTLQQYPTVVNFSGHTHYPLTDPRVAWQGNFTAFGTSTLSYICHGGEHGRYEEYPAGSGEYAEFYIMEVHADNTVTLLPYNLAQDAFYEFAYVVAPGKSETYSYTDSRYFNSARPVWRAGASLKLLETFDYGVDVEIPQASCPDVVHSYRCELQRRDKAGNWVFEAPQFFRARYYDRPVPETTVANVDFLVPDSEYRADFFALNPFWRASETPLTLQFKTSAEPDESVDRHAERPDANFIDARVVDGRLVNAAVNTQEKQIPLEIHGDVPLVDDAELGAKVAVFTGSPDAFVKLPCSAEDYRRLRYATLTARFRVASGRAEGSGALLGNTQGTGIELTVDYKERTLQFWATVGARQYTVVSAPIEFDRWIDAAGVFDGKSQILYIDGKEVGRVAVSGALRHPTDEAVRAFCFGADIAPGGGGSDFFSGRIARARLYNWPLTASQVEAVSRRDD